jgi:hypothetical protein
VTALYAVALAAVALSGCLGGEGGEPERNVSNFGEGGATDSRLLAHVSAALRARPAIEDPEGWSEALAYADLDAARKQLGLPSDASISGSGGRPLLLSFATRPFFRFSSAIGGRPTLGPLSDVLDGRRIALAVGTNFAFSGPGADEISAWDVLVLRTRQPFSEIAGLLRREGYEEAEDALLVADRRPPGLGPHPPTVPFPAVGDAGGGVVVFAGSPRAARVALRGANAELTETAELLARLSGAGRVARGPSGRCVVAVGLGEEAKPREGELVVVLDRPPRAERLLFGGRTYLGLSRGSEVTFDEATAEGDRVSARFTSTDKLNATRLPVENVARPYECP